MYMIFSFSNQNAETSSQLSYKVSCFIVKTADQVLDAGLEDWQIEEYARRYHHVTRKIAHMGEYFLLAVTVSFPLYVYGLHGILLMLLAGLICVGFACGDEYHQSFVAGRSPAVKDICIDAFGVFWGIILVRIIGWTGRNTIFRPLRNRDAALTRAQASRIRSEQDEMRSRQEEIRSEQRQAKKERKKLQRELDIARMEEEKRRRDMQRSIGSRRGLRSPDYDGQPGRDSYDPGYDERQGRNSYDPQYGGQYGRDSYDPRYGGQYSRDSYDPRFDGQGGRDSYDPRYDRQGGRDSYDPRYDRQYGRESYDPRYDGQLERNSYDPRFEKRYEDSAPDTSDTLSEDMPLSRLFRSRKGRR